MSIRKLPEVNMAAIESASSKLRRMASVGLPVAGADHGPGGPMAAIEVVAKELGETKNIVGDMLKAWSGQSQEVGARIRGLEQLVVARINDGTIGGGSHHAHGPSIGAMMLEDADASPSFKALQEWNSGSYRMKREAPIRAILTNDGSGSSEITSMPAQPERGGIRGPVLRQLRLIEVLPSRPVKADSVEYVQLHVTGDAEEQELEGDEKASVDFEGELRTANVATIAAHTTASKQVLADHQSLQTNIDRVMRHKVLDRLENQLVNGPGGQGKISGLLENCTVMVPSIATDPADVIGEAITSMTTAGYSPDLVIMHPRDWFKIQLTRTETENEYLFGSPTAPIPPALWNTKIVVTPSVPEGTALVVDTSFVTVLDREQPSVLVSNTHKDWFTRNLVEILGELRCGLEVADVLAVFSVELEFPS